MKPAAARHPHPDLAPACRLSCRRSIALPTYVVYGVDLNLWDLLLRANPTLTMHLGCPLSCRRSIALPTYVVYGVGLGLWDLLLRAFMAYLVRRGAVRASKRKALAALRKTQ